MTGMTAFDNSAAGTDGLVLLPGVCDLGPSGDEQIYQDVWGTFTPPVTKTYEISTFGLAGFDTRLAVYDQTSCPDDPLLVIACNDDAAGFPFEASVTVPLLSTSTYLVRLGSYDTFTGGGTGFLSIGDSVVSTPPANDDCSTSVPILTGLTAVDTRSATNGAGLPLDPLICDMGPFGDEQIYQDVWYSYTPTETRAYQVSSVGLAGFDSRIAIYEQATCPDDPSLAIECNDDATPINLEARVNATLDRGTTYLIRYGSYDDTTVEALGALSIEALVSAPPPSNDGCANAAVLPINFAVTSYDGTGATTDGSDSTGFCDYGLFGNEQNYNDIWFRYTPFVGGCTYISTLNQAGTDTRLTVYSTTDCPDDPATIIACADDEILGPPAPPFEAGLDVDLVAGQTYLIRLGTSSIAISNSTGNLVIASGPQAEANGGGANLGAPGCGPPTGFEEFCNGDGGDQMGCTNCPCGNNAPAGTVGGCINSVGQSLRLIGSGDPSISLPPNIATDLRFGLTGAPVGAFCILTSGTGVAPGGMANPCFGQGSGVQAVQFDGLRCAILNTRRHGGRPADLNGNVGDLGAPWGGEGSPPVGIAKAGVSFIVGQTRFFQVVSRDDPLLGCMRGLNTTQAVKVTFTP